jgi:hypothetical protein
VKARGRRLTQATLIGLILALVGTGIGLSAGYIRWGRQPNWYAVRDVAKLPPGPETDFVLYGYQLITSTNAMSVPT